MKGTRLSYSAHSTVSAPLRQTQALEFALASAADDAAIRRFLAGQSMPGGISLELRTEPSFFDAVALLGDAEVLVCCVDTDEHRPTGAI